MRVNRANTTYLTFFLFLLLSEGTETPAVFEAVTVHLGTVFKDTPRRVLSLETLRGRPLPLFFGFKTGSGSAGGPEHCARGGPIPFR